MEVKEREEELEQREGDRMPREEESVHGGTRRRNMGGS